MVGILVILSPFLDMCDDLCDGLLNASQAWRLYEGTHLFEGRAPDTKQWDPGYHLAEIVAVLGIPSAECLRRGKSYDTYFDKDG